MIRSTSAWDRLVSPSFTSSPCLNWLTVTWLTMRALFLLLAGSSKKGLTCSKARRWRGSMSWQLLGCVAPEQHFCSGQSHPDAVLVQTQVREADEDRFGGCHVGLLTSSCMVFFSKATCSHATTS